MTWRAKLTRIGSGQSRLRRYSHRPAHLRDMFAQMRAAMVVLRGGRWDGDDPPAGSSCADVLAAATIGGARACWLGELTGSLTPGKAADLLVMRPTRPVTTIEQAYGQVVWRGDGARLESVQVAGHEMLAAEQEADGG
jgi:5-methylthioadenosine/S-adenosylhomocysteine deaminase